MFLPINFPNFEDCEEQEIKHFDLPVFQLNKQDKISSEILDDSVIDDKIKNGIDSNDFFSLVEILPKTRNSEYRNRIISFYIERMNNPDVLLCSNPGSISSSFSDLDLTQPVNDSEINESISLDTRLFGLISTISKVYKYIEDKKIYQFHLGFFKLMKTLLPSEQNNADFMFYKMTIDCLLCILKLYTRKKLHMSNGYKLAHLLITETIAIETLIIKNVKDSNISLETYKRYFGLLFYPLADAIDLLILDFENKYNLIFQQLWFSMVILWGDVIEVFPLQKDELKRIVKNIPPLAIIACRIDYAHTLDMIRTLTNVIGAEGFLKQEVFANAFSNMIPSVPAKTVMYLDIDQSILLLSIAALEKTRAISGNFAKVFMYFESELNPTFSQCLNAMITPFFNIFQKEICITDSNERQNAIQEFASNLLREYHGLNPNFLKIIEICIKPFFKENQGILASHKVITAFIESYLSLEQISPSRVASFKEILQEEVKKESINDPNLFMSYLHHYYLPKYKELNGAPSISKIIDLMPDDFGEQFIYILNLKSNAASVASILSFEQLIQNEDPNGRTIQIAMKITQENNPDYLPYLLSNAKSQILIISWSHVATHSQKLFFRLNSLLVKKFLDLAKERKGIFSRVYDHETVEFQKSTLQFFLEQGILNINFEQISPILLSISDAYIIEEPGAISALIYLCLFVSVIIFNKTLPSYLYFKTLNLYLRSLLKIISLKLHPTIYKYLSTNDLNLLKQIIILVNLNYNKLKNDQENKLIVGNSHQLTRIINLHIEANRPKNQINSLYPLLIYSIIGILNQIHVIYLLYFNGNYTQDDLVNITYYYNMVDEKISDLLPLFCSLCPSTLPVISEILLKKEIVNNYLLEYIQVFPYELAMNPLMALFISNVKINDLVLFELLQPENSIVLLDPNVLNDSHSSDYLIRCLERFQQDEILQYIPQFVQALRFDGKKKLFKFLRNYAKNSELFTHYLLWNISYEKCRTNSKDDNLPNILVKLEGNLYKDMDQDKQIGCNNEFNMIEIFDKLSQQLLPLPIDKRKKQLEIELSKIKLPEGVYVPSNPEYKIISINGKKSIPLKSHAKVPILVHFNVYDGNKSVRKSIPFSCIFKIQDDVRMDSMVIQFMDKFLRIFNDAGISCYMKPYRVFATGQERGVIECITHAKSRHELGEEYPEDLLSYFVHKYGQIGTPEFNRAQHNFIISLAPYSLLSYIFQIKDRHNANIMIDDDGHILHIDFGFIFDISPGGGLKFERAPFKLTREMISLMGGKDSHGFKEFKKLYTQCFIATRSRYDEIEIIASLMVNAGFPCFTRDSFKNLRQRFFLDKMGNELSYFIDSTINDSMNSLTTNGYDMYQYAQNKIFYIT